MKKKSYLSLIWKRWKREMTARLPVTVSSVQTWFYMYAYVKKSSPGSTQLPTSQHLLSPPHSDLDDTHTHTHTHLQDGGSPWSPQASYDRRRHRNCFPTRKSASISEKVNISWGHRSVDALFTSVDLHVLSRSINMLSVTDFVRKWIISGVRVQAGLHLDMLDADRSPNMQSAFLPELHRWISKLIARHLHACPPGDLLITMVKETVILYKKEFRKMKKSRISPWCERDESAKWLRDCLWLCQACKRGFTCTPM